MVRPYCSIIIPAYNEAGRLPLTILTLDHYLERAPYSSEIIIVDDGSTDRTAEIVMKMAGAMRHLKLVQYNAHRGKGAAVRHGMLLANGAVRFYMNADGAIPVTYLDALIASFKKGAHVVVGSRQHSRGNSALAQILGRTVGRVANAVVQKLFLPGVSDPLCPLKGVSAEAAEEIFYGLQTPGQSFDLEVLMRALQYGYAITEIPVNVRERASHETAHGHLHILLKTATLRFIRSPHP